MKIHPIIIVSGDFNSLNTDFLEEYCGLTLIVHEITDGKRILDKVFTNRSDLFSSCVLRSLLKTKHMAVIVSGDLSFFNVSVSYDSRYKKIQCDLLFKNTDCELSVEPSEMESDL